MTSAPPTLLEARTYLLSVFDVQKGKNTAADLDPADYGIVPDAAHRRSGGYHVGLDDLKAIGRQSTDYSVRESPRDRVGLSDFAAACDIGMFSHTFSNGTRVDLRHLSRWLVTECTRGAPDTQDIREIIWSPDGRVVKRWDRLGKRTTGDISHLTHTHISEFRDAARSGRRLLTALFRRYVATFSGSSPPAPSTSKGSGMASVEDTINWELRPWTGDILHAVGRIEAMLTGMQKQLQAQAGATPPAGQQLTISDSQLEQLAVKLAARPDNPLSDADVPAIVKGVKQALAEGNAGNTSS